MERLKAEEAERALVREQARLEEEARLREEAHLKEEARLEEEARLREQARLEEETRLEAERAQWEADSASQSCRVCDKRFGLICRKHHCRKCGKLVCDACSKYVRCFHRGLGERGGCEQGMCAGARNSPHPAVFVFWHASRALIHNLSTSAKTQAQQGEENCVPLCKSPAHNHLALSKNLKTAHVLGASIANKLATLAAVMLRADQAKPFIASTAGS